MDNLLAPCNQCPSITDMEIGFIAGASVMLFKTLNGSSRYVYQVHGRSVAVMLVRSHSKQLGRVVSVYSLPDYSNGGLFRELYKTASKDFAKLKLGDELADNPQAFEFIHDIRNM